jgi:hypothetical protein
MRRRRATVSNRVRSIFGPGEGRLWRQIQLIATGRTDGRNAPIPVVHRHTCRWRGCADSCRSPGGYRWLKSDRKRSLVRPTDLGVDAQMDHGSARNRTCPPTPPPRLRNVEVPAEAFIPSLGPYRYHADRARAPCHIAPVSSLQVRTGGDNNHRNR